MYLLQRPSNKSILADLEKEAVFNLVAVKLHCEDSVLLVVGFGYTTAIRKSVKALLQTSS